MDKNQIDVSLFWHSRFSEFAEVLKRFYEYISKEYGDKLHDLLMFTTLAEKAQFYPWVYIDYGFRVPIYRTMQWLYSSTNINWSNIIKEIGKNRSEIESFAIDFYRHILKEYTLTWSTILKKVGSEKNKKALSSIIKKVLKMDREPIEVDPGAFGDLLGLGYELEACYVLIDHNKPFLPFSLMQAPITPSYIRPGISSGDLYLFEENLVIDVKGGGWFDKKNNLVRRKDLSDDLGKISNLGHLYGIRKGIGVVAEDDTYIHFAVYVPWRRWQREGPLLYLKSVKLPMLIFMSKFKGGFIEPHNAIVKDNGISLDIEVYLLGDIDLNCGMVEARLQPKEGRGELNMTCTEVKNVSDRRRIILLELGNINDIDKYVFSDNNMKFLALYMTVKIDQEVSIDLPVVALLS